MLQQWHDLFVSTAGSAAALTGLIFVGVSINLNRILVYPQLPDRALLTLNFLMGILILSMVLLIPGQPLSRLAIEIIVIGAGIWGIVLRKDISIYNKTDNKFKKLYLVNFSINQMAVLPYIAAGIFLLSGSAYGLYLIVLGFIISFIKSIIDSWVLLVEINR